ncbi:unnamed protein product [Hymenolepis diminuta]|uniref:ATP-dependent RNA helicase DHX29 n=1 Tax=Hymenolepis diminuta TaxID=6216 RepID=A0A0R3S9R9_HYMDI|nr:unnamed protein product [Hymenolepis diminuta]VUZ44743.1 unnamed protein product [Hymenolepis diminuta]
MSEKSSRLSPRSQDKFKSRSEVPEQNSSERLHFDDETFPLSPHESSTPSNSSHHHHHSNRRHRRDRDRHQDDTHSSSSNNKNRKHHGEDLKEIDAEISSERKRRRIYHEAKSEEKHLRKDRDKTRTKESKKGHRKQRSYEKEERKELRDKRSHRHDNVDERELYHQYEKEKSVESLKREHSCSVSRQSSVVHLTTYEGKDSPQSSIKSLSPFVATLLKPLLTENTSDTELEELLPAGILFGEIAKRSIPLPRSTDQSKRGATLQSHSQSQSQSSQNQSQELKTDSSSQQQGATASIDSSDPKQSVDENESRFDKFLSNLSDRLQEKEQEVETWGSGANEIDFSDILIEEEDTIRMVASAASLKPKQLLEACLSTPWDSLERRTEDEDYDKSEKTDEDKEEDPFDLVSLLSSTISRRYLDDELVKQLEERGVSLTSTAEKDCLSVDNFKSRMVPGVYEEKAWRQSLLGIIGI